MAVRMQSGGGSRHISVNIDATADDIIKEAVELFFQMERVHVME